MSFVRLMNPKLVVNNPANNTPVELSGIQDGDGNFVLRVVDAAPYVEKRLTKYFKRSGTIEYSPTSNEVVFDTNKRVLLQSLKCSFSTDLSSTLAFELRIGNTLYELIGAQGEGITNGFNISLPNMVKAVEDPLFKVVGKSIILKQPIEASAMRLRFKNVSGSAQDLAISAVWTEIE